MTMTMTTFQAQAQEPAHLQVPLQVAEAVIIQAHPAAMSETLKQASFTLQDVAMWIKWTHQTKYSSQVVMKR